MAELLNNRKNSQLDVSIIIVNWNTCDILRNCLASLYTNTKDVEFEVIVIDNASSDGSVDMVKSEFPQVEIITNTENRGFAAANNQGIAVARGRYVLLLNSDTIVCDAAIEKTVAYADCHPEVAVVGCQVWKSQEKVQMTCFRFPSIPNLLLRLFGLSKIFKKNRVFGREWMGYWPRDSEREVDVVSGMFMLVRHTAIDEVGLMDEDYFFYSEEVDWCYRLSKAGWKIMFWPGARIIHVHGGGQSSKKIPLEAYVQQVKSKLTYFKKHRGFVSYLSARLIFATLFGLKYCMWTIAVLAKLKRGEDTAYELEKQKAWHAFRFSVFGLEPGEKRLKSIRFLLRKASEIVEFICALIYYTSLAFVHNKPRRVILYYHGVKRQGVKQFEKQMQYLANKCHVVKVSEVKTFMSNRKNVLTSIIFDDAFVSVMENAVPILKKYGFQAGFSIPSGCLSHQPRWSKEDEYYDKNEIVASEQQVQELDKEGFEILSHTVSHPHLTQLDDDTLRAELVDSKQSLEEIIAHEVVGICYPYGAYNGKVCRAAEQAGYRFGFTIEPCMVDVCPEDFQIGRFIVSPKDSILKFKLKASGAYQATKYLRMVKRVFVGKI